MKKRILSFLLLVVMLVTMIPVTAVVAETAPEEEAPQTTYLDLYVKADLKMLYDAIGVDNPTVDIAGKTWTPYVLVDDKLTLSTANNATIVGEPKTESHTAGWTTADGGLGYVEHTVDTQKGVTGNYLQFDTANYQNWAFTDYEIEFLFTPHMRNNSAPVNETLTIPEGVEANGDVTYSFSRSIDWKDNSSGRGGWYFTLSVPYGVTPDAAWTKVTEATEDTPGVYTYTKNTAGKTFELSLPAGVAVTKAEAAGQYLVNGKYTTLDAVRAFQFGNFYGYAWTSLGVWSNWPQGDGEIRWYYRSYIWNQGSDLGGSGDWDFHLKNNNEKLDLMSVTHINSNYTAKHGGKTLTLNLKSGLTESSYASNARFFVLFSMPGTAYSYRIYNRALNTNEKLQNRFADMCGLYGLDVSDVDPAFLASAGAILNEMATYGYEGADKATLQGIVDRLVALQDLKAEMTVYDKLYVSDDLQALYTAYKVNGEADPSLSLAAGVWLDKLGGDSAVIGGSWQYEADGGFGYHVIAEDQSTFDATAASAWKDNMVSFPDALVAGADFHVENVIRFRRVVDTSLNAYTNGTTQLQAFGGFIGDYSGFRIDVLCATAFFGTRNSGHNNRWYITNYARSVAYGANTTNGSTVLSLATGVDNTVKQGPYTETLTHNSLLTFAAFKATNKDGSVTYSLANNGTVSATQTLTAAQYATVTSVALVESTSRFGLFHNVPGAVYAVRAYSRVLDASEVAQNKFVDLCAYFGVDIPEGVTEEVLAEEMKDSMTSIASTYNFNSNAQTVKAAIGAAFTAATLEPTVLDTLYIGADGGKTVNGGSLKALYTAYGETDASVSLDAGLWFNKVEGPDAILMGSTWKKEANGISTIFTYENMTAENRLKLDVSLLGNYNDDFTVEYAAKYPDLLKNDGTVYQVKGDNTVAGNADTNGEKIVDALGFLKTKVTVAGKDKWDSAKERALRWYFSSGISGWQVAGNSYGWSNLTDYSRASRDAFVTTVVRDVTVGASETLAAYAMKTNGTVQKSATLSTVTPKYGGSYFNGTYPTANNNEEQFYLFNGQPAVVYAVRVYDAALTNGEIAHNRAVDLLAYFGYEMTAERAAVIGNIDSVFDTIAATYSFTTDAAAFKNGVDALFAKYEAVVAEKTEYDKLYVTDGLLSLYSAYEYTDDTVVGSIWADKVGGNHANLFGSFVANRGGKGGFGVSYDKNAWSSDNAASTVSGINLPAGYADLPAFTVENIMSVENYDNWTTGNLYYKKFHTFRFDVYSASMFENAGFRTALTAKSWNQHNGVPADSVLMAHGSKYADPAHNNDLYYRGYLGGGFSFGLKQVKNMTVTKSSTADTVSFALTLNGAVQSFGARDDMWASAEDKASGNTWANGTTGKSVYTTIETRATISKDAYNTVKNGANTQSTAFSVMYGMPGTMYAVRVYNRVLTTAEQNQNHAVDLFAYTGVSLENYPEDALSRAWIAEQLASTTFAKANKATIEALFVTELVTVTFKDEQGATLDSYKVAAGANVALPLYANGLNAIWWNDTLRAGTSTVVTEDTVFVADTIIAPISDGVSMRVASGIENVGLRFFADFAVEDWATIAKGAERIHLGMLITPVDFVTQAGAFTKEALDAFAGEKAGYVDITLPGYYEKTDDTYTLAASIVGLQQTTVTYDVTFAAIAYLEIDFDGDGAYDRVIYGTCDLDACKSISTIVGEVKSAIDDETTDLVGDQVEWFNEFYETYYPVAE